MALISFGVIVIYSAGYIPDQPLTKTFAFRQAIWFSMGFMLCLMVSMMDYKIIQNLSVIFYFLAIGGLLLVMVKGTTTLGAQRWVAIGPLKIQPSEFAKIAIVLMLAFYLSWNNSNKDTLSYIFYAFVISGLPLLLIVKQPDLGTALVCVPTIFVMLFASGARIKYLMIIVFIGLLLLPLGWFVLKDYQKMRILVFINPEIDPLGSGYTIIQSKIAIGSGSLWGAGWLGGTQTRLKFLPERHTDFIFSVIGEEWGFVGVVCVLCMFFFIFRRGLRIATIARDLYGRLVAVGIVMLIFSHVMINVGMTVGVMPITGLPLPFLSYGGSVMLTMFVGIGLLESICAHRFMFSR